MGEPTLAGKRILVVDDEGDVLETVADVIGDEVGELLLASSYDEACEVFETAELDAAVVDLMGVRGIDLIYDYSRKLPLVVLTGQAVRRNTIEWMQEVEVRAFMPKDELDDLDRCLRMVFYQEDSLYLWELWRKVRDAADPEQGMWHRRG